MSKLKAALLAAAMEQLESKHLDQKGKSVQWDTNVREEKPKGGTRETGTTDGRRRSTGDEANCRSTGKHKQLIWDFFEEGRNRSSCRTCGYTVSTKTNTGGLVRHLSLVHQREYREYTSRMDKNWTHGMMEKNLNMRIPKNF